MLTYSSHSCSIMCVSLHLRQPSNEANPAFSNTPKNKMELPESGWNASALGDRSYDTVIMYVRAYLAVGKDTFVQGVVSGKFQHSWLAYADPDTPYVETLFWMYRARLIGTKPVAFADPIRDMLSKKYLFVADFDWRAYKDTLIMPGGKVLRQHMIELGGAGRTKEPGYWAKRALLPVATGILDRAIVSDHRFPDEATGVKSVLGDPMTVMLFRKDVPVPPSSMASEHALDNTPPYVLLVPSEEDFNECIRMLPNLSHYQKAFVINANT
jgi:hypothetical protein